MLWLCSSFLMDKDQAAKRKSEAWLINQPNCNALHVEEYSEEKAVDSQYSRDHSSIVPPSIGIETNERFRSRSQSQHQMQMWPTF
jgi:hypothetical protein